MYMNMSKFILLTLDAGVFGVDISVTIRGLPTSMETLEIYQI
mgnify:FL=1